MLFNVVSVGEVGIEREEFTTNDLVLARRIAAFLRHQRVGRTEFIGILSPDVEGWIEDDYQEGYTASLRCDDRGCATCYPRGSEDDG